MRRKSGFFSFIVVGLLTTAIPQVRAREKTGHGTRAATMSVPEVVGNTGQIQITSPGSDSVPVQFEKRAASSVIRIRFGENGRMLVPVTVNGSGTCAFLVDTGASMTMLNQRLAKKLGAPAAKTEWVNTFAGRVALSARRVESLQIGNSRIAGGSVLIGDLAHLFNLTPEVDGILGQDVLSLFNYIIDRRAGSLEIEEGNTLSTGLIGTKVPFERRGGVIYVPAAGGALHLILDSGNPHLVIYEDAAPRCHAILTAIGGDSVVASSLGRRIFRLSRLPSLEIGGSALRNVEAILETRGRGRLEDGLLPPQIFDSIYLNNLEKFLIVNPERNR